VLNQLRRWADYWLDIHNYYASGIMDLKLNKMYSATFASLLQLGAYDLCILQEDRDALKYDAKMHYVEDLSDKVMIIGSPLTVIICLN
jgi:hypothetical protein